MEQQPNADPALIERKYRGFDLDDAQRRAWEDQASAWAVGYVAVAQRWDADSRTLTVRFAPRPQLQDAPQPAFGPRPPWAPQYPFGPPASQWGRPSTVPRWRLIAAVALIIVLGASAVVARFADTLMVREPTVIRAGTDTGSVPRVEPAVCRGQRVALALPRCGDLVVAEDRARPGGTHIRLHYAVYPSESGSADPDPVVYLDGGPGGSPLTDGFPTDPFVATRELVVLDQRGTGFSEPSLDCDEVDSLDAVTSVLAQQTAIGACRARLIGQGVDLARYTSADSASDVEELRLALGYPAWNLYGVSYGTRLALTVMRDHPAGVRSAILDSVYPPQVDAYADHAANAERAFGTLFSACEHQPRCASAYPDLEGTLFRTVDDLDHRMPSVARRRESGGTTTLELDGDMLLGYLFDRLYDSTALSGLPMAIADVRDGDYDELADWALEAQPVDEPLVGQDVSEGMELSVQCAEELPFSAGDPPAIGPHAQRLAATFGVEAVRRQCAVWNVPAADERERQPVTSSIPTLLLSGEFDPITPPEWAKQATDTLSRAQAFEFPAVGHGVLGSTSCADGLVSAFLARPLEQLDARCIGNLPGPVFALP